MLLGVVDRKIPSVSSEICDNSNRNWRYFTALYETEGANAQNGYGDFVFFLLIENILNVILQDLLNC